MSDRIRPLRPDVAIVERPGDREFPASFEDRRLKQAMKLDALGLAIARLLDREQPFDELLARAEAAGIAELSPERLTKIVEVLGRYHLLDSDETRAFVEDYEASQRPQGEMPLLFLDETDRFHCVMCGSCCGGQNIGPVEPEVLERLRPKREELIQLTRSEKGLFLTMDVDGKKNQAMLRMRDEVCVFLDDTNKCILHREYGPDHKPLVCNIFPLYLVRTPKGIVVSFQMECRSYLQSKRAAAEPLSAQEPFIRAWLSRAPEIPTMRPVVPLDGAIGLRFDAYEQLEREMLATIERHRGDPREAIVAATQLLDERRGGSRNGQGTHGEQPDRSESADGLSPRARLSVSEYAERLYALRDALVADFEALRSTHGREEADFKVHVRGLEYFVETLRHFEAKIGLALRHRGQRDEREVWYDTLRHYYYSKEATTLRSLVYAQAAFAFRYLLIRVYAILRARTANRRGATPQDTFDALVQFNYLFRNTLVKRTLAKHADAIEELFFEQAPLLFDEAEALARPSKRFELFMF